MCKTLRKPQKRSLFYWDNPVKNTGMVHGKHEGFQQKDEGPK